MGKGKKGFLIFHDQEVLIQELSDDAAGRILKALFRYSIDHEEASFSAPEERMAYRVFCASLDRNEKEYQAICEKRSEAAQKRYKKESGSSGSTSGSEIYRTEFDDFKNKNN